MVEFEEAVVANEIAASQIPKLGPGIFAIVAERRFVLSPGRRFTVDGNNRLVVVAASVDVVGKVAKTTDHALHLLVGKLRRCL